MSNEPNGMENFHFTRKQFIQSLHEWETQFFTKLDERLAHLNQPAPSTKVASEDFTVRDILAEIGATKDRDVAGYVKHLASNFCIDHGITPRVTGDKKKYARYPTFVKDYVISRYKTEMASRTHP